jgi:hypothetical protein
MSDELVGKFRVQLEGKDELNNFFDSSQKGADKFSANLRKNLASAGGVISSFAGKAKSELQAFAGQELGGSIGSQARGVLQLRDAIDKLAVSAGNKDISGLKDQIQAVSVASNQLQGDVTEALQAFVERTGDLATARKNLELYAKTATATGATLEDVARVGESLSSKFKITDQAKAFQILALQAKAGSIELRDVATQGASIFTAARAAGIGGAGKEEQGVREIGGLLQAIAGGAKGKNKATAADTAVMIAAMFSQVRQKSGLIESLGVKVQDRDYIDVIKDLIVKTGGDSVKLGAIFKNERAFRGVSTLALQYKEDKGFKNLDALTNPAGDAGVLDRDFKQRTSTGEQKLKAAKIARDKFVDSYFGGIAEFAAAHAQELQVGAFGAGLLGKGMSFLGSVGGGTGGKLGGAFAKATAMPVRVVNFAEFNGGVPGMPGAPGGKGKLGVGAIVPVIGAALAGWEVGKQLDEGDKTSDAIADMAQYATGGKKNLDKQRQGQVESGWRLAMAGIFGGSKGLAEQARQEVKNNIKIEIHDGVATVTENGGTRSSVNLETRKADAD